MASVLEVNQNQAAPTEPRRSKISVKQKRALLSIHLVFITAWLGGGICSIALNITALRSTDPHLLNAIYVYADIFEKFIVRSGAAGTLITGLLLAFLTQWGLLRFYWIIAKELLTLSCIAIDQIIIRWNANALSVTAAQGLDALNSPLYLSNRSLIFLGVGLQIVLMAIIIVISVFKPWGQRKRRQKADSGLAQSIVTGKMKPSNAGSH